MYLWSLQWARSATWYDVVENTLHVSTFADCSDKIDTIVCKEPALGYVRVSVKWSADHIVITKHPQT